MVRHTSPKLKVSDSNWDYVDLSLLSNPPFSFLPLFFNSTLEKVSFRSKGERRMEKGQEEKRIEGRM